jgi:hypothetical protein
MATLNFYCKSLFFSPREMCTEKEDRVLVAHLMRKGPRGASLGVMC